MIPRFSNPHLLTVSTRLATRADIYKDENEGGSEDAAHTKLSEAEPQLERLGELVKRSLEVDTVENPTRRKRRKLNETLPEEIENLEDNLPFRLVSSSLPPIRVSLKPKPPPPSKVREPPCEDTETEAKLRRERAEAIAVDFTWVISESQKVQNPPDADKKLLRVTAALPSLFPPILIGEKPQLPRSTRPPGRTHLSTKPETRAPELETVRKAPQHCLVVPIIVPSGEASTRKRRKGYGVETSQSNIYKPRPRPQPVFWRPPNAEIRGKSLGYAYGYPGSWAPYRESDQSSEGRWYSRDTMKTGMHAEAV